MERCTPTVVIIQFACGVPVWCDLQMNTASTKNRLAVYSPLLSEAKQTSIRVAAEYLSSASPRVLTQENANTFKRNYYGLLFKIL